jgi:hypothetical protein
MSTVTLDIANIRAKDVVVTDDALAVELVDGRSVTVPLTWFPRLLAGTPEERHHWRLIGEGVGIHWPDLDEDIRVAGLLAGQASNESPRSLQRWFEQRAQHRGQ